MKKIKRWFLILLSAFVVFLGVGSIVAWHYKPELSAAIHDKIKEHINGEFNIDDISVSFFQDFPHVSVRLEGIYLRGLRYELYKKDFLKAKKVFVNVHLGRLFLGEIDVKSVRIEDAEIFIFKTRSGYSNLDIFKKDSVIALVDSTKKKGSAILNIHTIDLKNVSVAFYDSLKDKAFAAKFVEGRNELSKTDSVRHFKYTGGIDFDRLQFNGKKGSYLLAQQTAAILEGDFTPASHSLSIAPSSLKFKSSTIGISGYFHFVKDGRFKLDITSDDLSYKEGISLMPKALSSKLENYNISNPFALQVHILGSLAPGNDPAVDVLFQTKDAVVTIGKQQATRVTTSGLFTNHVDSTREFNDPNSKIEVTSFEGDVYGFPVKAKASFMNLRDPFLKLNATMTTDAKSVQRQLDSTTFRLTDGQIDAKLIYAGKLNDLIDPARHLVSGQLSGATVLKNVQLHYIPRDLVLNNINALLTFTPQQLLINNMSMLVDKSQIALKGKVDGLAAAFNHADKKIFVRLAVSSANLVTTNLFPEPPKTENVSDKPKGKSLSETIDKLYRRLEFDLSLNVQQFEHGNFKASNITGAVSLKNNHLDGERIRMKLAGGETDVSFGLSDLDKNVNPLWVEANVHRADIRQFFHCFNNFKQKNNRLSELIW